MLELIREFVSNIFLAWDIFWQMGTVEQVYHQFVTFSREYYNTGTLPSQQILEEFSNKVHNLKVVEAYCNNVDIVEMIKSSMPFEKLHDYCDIPKGLTEEMAKKFIK